MMIYKSKLTLKPVFRMIVAFTSVCLMIGLLSISQFSWAASPKDISGHWAETYINRGISEGILQGYSDGTFKPDQAVTRAEFVSIINRTLGNTGTKNVSFSDISSGDWYYNDVLKANSATYVAGYDDGRFLPNNPISRQEAAVMIARFVPSYGQTVGLSKYSDSSSVASWASPSLSKVSGKGYIGAYNDGLLHPEDKLTRAQTIKIVCEIKDKESIVASDPLIRTNKTFLSDKIYSNGVTIQSSLGDGSATLSNCIILGDLNVAGGGNDSVILENCRVANAAVNRSAASVRVVAKGETTVANLTAGNTAILETSSLAGGAFGIGFSKISISYSANTTLRGSFPSISIDGSSATINLESATAEKFAVTSSGRNSTINTNSKSTISSAIVDAACNFYGAGSITNMQVNTSGVTYETKPKAWTIASGVNAPTMQAAPLTTTFNPANAAANIKLNANLSITFSTPMTLYDRKNIGASDIQDFVTLRKDSSSGVAVKFTGSIDSTKKVITIDPTADLETNTRYYIIVSKNALKDTSGEANTAYSVYFDTEKNSSVSVFSPENGKENVALTTSITITLPESAVRYSNGATLVSDSSYLKECVEFKKTSSSGSTVAFSASINSSKKIITISPNANLDAATKYYVSVVANKMKTDDKGTVIPASSVTWTTAGAPILSELSATPLDKSAEISARASVSGNIYAIAVASNAAAPTPSQIVAANAPGQKSSGNVSVSSGNKAVINLSGLDTETDFKVYAVLRNSSASLSGVLNAGFKTTKINLANLTVSNVNSFNFKPTEDNYTLTAKYDTSSVRVAADVGVGSFPGTITINGVTNSSQDIDVPLEGTVVTVVVKESAASKTAHTYKLTIKKIASPNLKTLTINDSAYTPSETAAGATAFKVEKDAVSFNIVCEDPSATVTVEGSKVTQSAATPLTLDFGGKEYVTTTIVVTSSDESAVKQYYVLFYKPTLLPPEETATT